MARTRLSYLIGDASLDLVKRAETVGRVCLRESRPAGLGLDLWRSRRREGGLLGPGRGRGLWGESVVDWQYSRQTQQRPLPTDESGIQLECLFTRLCLFSIFLLSCKPKAQIRWRMTRLETRLRVSNQFPWRAVAWGPLPNPEIAPSSLNLPAFSSTTQSIMSSNAPSNSGQGKPMLLSS